MRRIDDQQAWHRIPDRPGFYRKVPQVEAEGYEVGHRVYTASVTLSAHDLVTALALYREIRRLTPTADFPDTQVRVLMEIDGVAQAELDALDDLSEISADVELSARTEGIYYREKAN